MFVSIQFYKNIKKNSKELQRPPTTWNEQVKKKYASLQKKLFPFLITTDARVPTHHSKPGKVNT
tara:strand:+ start:2200 stop:2391 length:192 start_codon:yes stop_codon:yes gene_type:complete